MIRPWKGPDDPGRGLWSGYPAHRYHQHPSLSRSRVSRAATLTPAHYQAFEGLGKARHLDVGDAAHMLLLEPERFVDEVVSATQCEGVTVSGKRCSRPGTAAVSEDGDCFCHNHLPPPDEIRERATILSAEDYGTVIAMNGALAKNRTVMRILAEAEALEVTGIFEVEGADARFRADIVGVGGEVLWDLKTSRSILANENRIAKVLADYAYHHQAGWYTEGWARTTGGERPGFGFILQEKKPPFAVRVVQLHNADIDIGWKQMADAVRAIQVCENAGQWPAYPDKILTVELPYYVTDTDFTEEKHHG